MANNISYDSSTTPPPSKPIPFSSQSPLQAMDEFKARESQLQRDMDMLFSKLEEEKEHVRQNQDMTNRILATRIELDTELGILKKKYTEEAKVWESKLQAEKAAHVSDVAKAQAEVERLKKEVEEMSKERNSLGSLFKQSMKVMFGMDE
jgi:cytochrome c556